MVSELVLNIVHAAVSAAVVYVPAYVFQTTLNQTLMLWFVTTIVLAYVLKQVKTAGSATDTWTMVLIGLVPWVLIGMKFGLFGVFAFFGTGILAAFASTLIERL